MRAIFLVLLPMCLLANDHNRSGEANSRQLGYSVGAAVSNVQYFDVGSVSKIRLLPYADLRYGSFFISPAYGVGANISMGGGFIISPALGLRAGRKESEDKSLSGMGNIDVDGTYGIGLAYMRERLTIGAKVFRGFDKGTIYGLSIGSPIAIGKDFTIIPGVSAQYNDRLYNQKYLGVNADQSARSNYPIYAPDGGFQDISFYALFNYKITDRWSANLFGRHRKFVDKAANSPIVKANGFKQTNYGILFVYSSPQR